ncbi:MAG TPA: MBL fold metallo-hydrolase [Casimicrobiaceae bacterium]|nr:MBL fold metallo-hydrolase [Casimicrobiaceae bacterium]
MRITLYGGFGEKGRTCVGVESAGYRVLLDAGVMTSARGGTDYYPVTGAEALRAQDAIVLAHAHEDHVAALGFCIANGFHGRIFMTPETARESRGILDDYAEPAHAALAHAARIEPLPVGAKALTLGPFAVATGRSGHIAGGVWCALDDGHARLVYCSDVAPAGPVFAYDPIPRCDALIIDASYADDATSAAERAADIAAWIGTRPEGCVLPTPLFGRSAELLAIVPEPIALAPGMRAALSAQIEAADWLIDGVAGRLRARLARANDHDGESELPRAALLCHDGMGMSGSSPAILALAQASAHPTLFTGHIPAGTPGERMLRDKRASWIRLPTHPTLQANVALCAAAAPALVLGHSCDAAALTRLARHIPNLRADAKTGDIISVSEV